MDARCWMCDAEGRMLDTGLSSIRYPTQSLPCELLLRQPEPALPPLVLDKRRMQVLFREVGPERIGEIKFRVCGLPEEEVADPLLAARADDQVRVGEACGVQVRGKDLVSELQRRDPRGVQPPDRLQNFSPPAVGQREVQHHAAIGRGFCDGPIDPFAGRGRKALYPADGAEPDVV